MESLSIYQPCNLIYTQESLLRYKAGGYHPVRLGDTFKDGRYAIHDKLGWGGFSTVWLARDARHKQWIAVKIMTADSTGKTAEVRHLKSLATKSPGNAQSKYIVRLLDEFHHEGPNGKHQCLVFELLGPSVDAVICDYRHFGDRLEPEIVLRMSRQLLEAIAVLHELGYAHGDLSCRNVAFASNRLSKLSKAELLEVLGAPEPTALVRLDGKSLGKGLPSQLVKTTTWDSWIDEDEEDIRILDFGEAFLQNKKPTKLAQPPEMQVPETIFTDTFDHRVDLWRAGIMIYSFTLGACPFFYLGEVDVLVAQMINFVEELPPSWRPKWDHMRATSKQASRPSPSPSAPTPKSKLEQTFDKRVPEPTLKPLLPVIQGLMRFLPSDRISASQALDLLDSQIAKRFKRAEE